MDGQLTVRCSNQFLECQSMVEHLEFWLDGGKRVERPVSASGEKLTDKQIFQMRGMVKVATSDQGTQVKWVQFAANWSNLFFVCEWLKVLPAPFSLQFFNAGWFSESHPYWQEAAARINGLIANSDVRLSTRTYLREFDPEKIRLPQQLEMAWAKGLVPEDRVVVCEIDAENERTAVSFVGEKSALASVWGISPVSYPCLSGHSYDKVVSRPYFEVLRTGRPYHDHVLAAMATPDGEVSWLTYQRLIFPTRSLHGRSRTVHVMCEGAPVDIPVL
jgi:hypothetical protein